MTRNDKSPRQLAEDAEKQGRPLCESATFSSDEGATRREHGQAKCPFRTDFQRDYTRIIHSRPFRRLRHKAQVFVSPQNDHICTRIEHHLHVASVAGTIAQALGLNVDLVRGIAIGHDLGHTPFGHKGERSLAKIAEERAGDCPELKGDFCHELHGLRVVDLLESPYHESGGFRGLNLTFAVRDGIACHCGEEFEQRLSPQRDKKPEALKVMTRGTLPATLEGCVVRWSDKIAYLGRDFEDAIILDLLRRDALPSEVSNVLGSTNSEIIGALIRELVDNGIREDAISIGPEVHAAIKRLYAFNMDRIYHSPQAERGSEQIGRSMRAMFDLLVHVLTEDAGDTRAINERGDPGGLAWRVLAQFLDEDIDDWATQPKGQLAFDFIAGMTDSFFCKAFNDFFLPGGAV